MHKVQMNSSASDTIRARVARFNEFDNGHVLFDYQKMTEAEFEERAKAASIKDPNDVYYVAIDNIMEPGTDVYWFQGKSYDYEGAEKALSDYQKSATSGLNSGRRPLNSSEEQVKVSGIVTIYSDFVDFKRSVSEHLLQTAVGDRAKLKFKWVGDNKVEVKAICSVADERKVKILLENSDVTKTITWNTSANSSRLNSATLQKGDKIRFKQVGGTLSREVGVVTDVYKDKDIGKYDFCTIRWSDGDISEDVDVDQCVKVGRASQQYLDDMAALNSDASDIGSCFATLWSAYIDDEYKCACCGKPFPAGHNSVQLNGHKPDGMHFIFEYTKENREGNSVNYDPYNLPKEDPEGGIFKVVVGEDADDEGYHWLNFCRNCWPKLTSMSPEEIYAKYSKDAGLNSAHRSNALSPKEQVQRCTGWADSEFYSEFNKWLKAGGSNSPRDNWHELFAKAVCGEGVETDLETKTRFSRLSPKLTNQVASQTGWSPEEIIDAFDQWLYDNCNDDDCSDKAQFGAFARAVTDAVQKGQVEAYFGIPLKASRKSATSAHKINSNKGGKSMRKVNSGKTSRKKLNSSYRDSYVDVDGIMGSRGDVWTIAELADYWYREQHNDPCLDEYASYEDWLDDTLAAMRPVNSSRKPASKSTRKKLNSARNYDSRFDTYLDFYTIDEMKKLHDLPIDDEDIDEEIETMAEDGYGKVIGFMQAKPEYEGWFPVEGFYVTDGGKLFVANPLYHPTNPGEYLEYSSDELDDAIEQMNDLDSSRKPASKGTRKRLNSSKKSEIIELTGWSPDDLADAFDQWLYDGGAEYEEDEQFDRFADAVAESVERGDTEEYFGVELKASCKHINSNRKVGNNSMRKVIFRGKLNSSRKLNSAAGSNDVSGVLKAALAKTQLPNDFNYSTPRRIDDGMLTTLTVRLPDGTKSWADKCYIEGDLATGDWAFGSYAPDGQQPAAGSFGFQTVSGLDTEAKAVAWLKKQLEDCAKFYKENPPKRIARVLDSSRKPAQKAARKKLNSSSDIDNPMYAEYYDKVATIEQAAKRLAADDGMTDADTVDSLTDMVAETEGNHYGKVVGFLVPKPEYFDVLDENNLSILFVLDNGDIGRQFGRRFYGVDEELTELVDMELLNSSRKLNSSEGESDDDADAGESVGEGADAPASEGETEVQDTGVEGGEDAAETAEILEDALIVQNPETKEVALFIADAEDETVPEDVDVIAEVDVVADETEVLDSSRRLKKFATAKLNSSKGCLNSDADVCPGCGKPYDECECEPGTVAYDEIQLPDDTVVEVENILVVQDDEGELGLFMPEDAEEAVPEGYEVVATATPAAQADVLDSSRRMKKSNAKKLNSSVKKKNLNSGKQSLESRVKSCLREAGLTASSVNQGTDMGSPVVNVIFRPKDDWRDDINAYYKAQKAYSDKYYDSSTVGGWLRDKEGYEDGPEATALNEAQAAANADAAAYEEEIKAAIAPVLEAAGFDFSIRYFNECGASNPEMRYWGGSQVFLRVTDPNYQRQAKSGAAKMGNRNQSPERKLINSLQAYFEENGFGWNDREVYRNAAATPGNYNIVIKGLSGAPADTEEFIRTTAAELGLNVRRCVVADKEVRIGTARA